MTPSNTSSSSPRISHFLPKKVSCFPKCLFKFLREQLWLLKVCLKAVSSFISRGLLQPWGVIFKHWLVWAFFLSVCCLPWSCGCVGQLSHPCCHPSLTSSSRGAQLDNGEDLPCWLREDSPQRGGDCSLQTIVEITAQMTSVSAGKRSPKPDQHRSSDHTWCFLFVSSLWDWEVSAFQGKAFIPFRALCQPLWIRNRAGSLAGTGAWLPCPWGVTGLCSCPAVLAQVLLPLCQVWQKPGVHHPGRQRWGDLLQR